MASKCEKCDKSKNLMNEHLFKKIENRVYCNECYKTLVTAIDEHLLNIKITTTSNFEGYKIIDYLGIDSVEVVIGTGILGEFVSDLNDVMGTRSTNFEKKLQEAKNIGFNKLRKKANDVGANAIVGIDLDYTEFSSNKIGVIINGTFVKIEKIN